MVALPGMGDFMSGARVGFASNPKRPSRQNVTLTGP